MLSRLRYPILLKMKKRRQDGEGGFEEIDAGHLEVLAAISPLSSKPLLSSPKSLEAFSPCSLLVQERYEVIIREHPELRQIAEVVWDEKILAPLTKPQPMENHGGYLSFKVFVLMRRET